MADVGSVKGYKIAIIGDRLLASGMKLSGIKQVYEAINPEEAEQAVRKVLEREDIGMVVINENLVEKMRDRKVLNAIDKSLLPVFIEVPAFREEERYTDTLRRLIIRAIGIDITK